VAYYMTTFGTNNIQVKFCDSEFKFIVCYHF